ncbi:MAG TPA: extracellular solute-binding protein, partial [Limnochorda sp.]
MSPRTLRAFVAVLLLVGLSVPAASAQIEIDFWHSMSGAAGRALNELVARFNASQSEIRVNAQFSGSYAEALTRAIAALRTGQAPNILQVYEVGTQTMLDSGAIIPVYELAESRGGIDFGDISRPIFDYYAVDGKLYSMPFNSSTAMLYYNKDAFRKAGLDPNRPPTTFDEVLEMGRQIVASGAAPAAISFGWPAWVFEQAHA